MLVELNLVEQRYQAVLEVLNDGASVTDVARRFGVARQTVHEWLRRYAAEGLGGLADHSSTAVVVPASDGRRSSRRGSWRCAGRIRGGGRARSCSGSTVRGCRPLPGRTSVERCLVRHGLVTPQARKRKRSDYKRWERSPGDGVVADGHRRRCPPRRWVSEAKIVSGIDDHSRFVVSAQGGGAGDGAAGV